MMNGTHTHLPSCFIKDDGLGGIIAVGGMRSTSSSFLLEHMHTKLVL